MSIKLPAVAAVSAVLTALVASSPDAGATFKRQHASFCTESSLPPQVLFTDQFMLNSDNQFFDVLYCGFQEDTALPKQRVSRLVVTGIDQTVANSVFARACVGFSSGFGAQCDATVINGDVSVTGGFTINLPHTTWNSSHRLDFAYVQVAVPPAAPSASGISGLFIADVNG